MGREAGEDLHLHTPRSGDSDYLIEDIVQDILRIQKGNDRFLQEVAITDHNTLSAIVPFRDMLLSACAEHNAIAPEVIPGCEVSLWHGEGRDLNSYHILTYFPVRGSHFKEYVETLDRGPFGQLIRRVNDIKRKRMALFLDKWITNGFLPSVKQEELEALIWHIDSEIGDSVACGHEGPAYMRDNAFHILERLYTAPGEILEIKRRLNLKKGDPERERVQVDYEHVDGVVPIIEGLQIIKSIPGSYTFFAHPWNHDHDGSYKTIEDLMRYLHAQGLIDGIQTQGYGARAENTTLADGTRKRVKIYERMPREQWEQFASQHGMRAVSGSDAHGTHKQGIKATALPYHEDKFSPKDTYCKNQLSSEQSVTP